MAQPGADQADGVQIPRAPWWTLPRRASDVGSDACLAAGWRTRSDPYYAAAEIDGQVRVLATSRGLTGNNTFYLASRTLAAHEPSLRGLFAVLTETDAYVQSNRKDTAQRFADFAGLGLATVHRFLGRRNPSPVGPLTPALVAEQQKVADAFLQLGLIPKASATLPGCRSRASRPTSSTSLRRSRPGALRSR